MHDIVDFETRGLPSVFVATVEFADAAERQARALGFDPAAVYVPHPVQDRTDEELRAMADAAYEGIQRALASSWLPPRDPEARGR